MNSESKEPKTFMQRAKSAMPMVYLILGMLALRWTVIEPYVVPTGSMEPTLKTGDRLYALKCAYDIRLPFTDYTLVKLSEVKRGDVILFIAPHEPDKTYVKRAIGLPGDEVEVRNGVIFINGKEVDKQVYPDRKIMYDIPDEQNKSLFVEQLGDVKHYVILDNEHPDYRNSPAVKVPPDHIFAMGDNRDHSFDSRGWGFVPMQNMKGRAMFIWFSFWDTIRLEKIGALIQ